MPKSQTWSDAELEAMKAHAAEAKAGKLNGEDAVLEKISQMQEPDKSMAKKLHEIVKKHAPELAPKTWYGMPAYANKAGKTVCFFQSGKKFQTRYCSFGFNDSANLDDGNFWPTGFALTKLGEKEEKQIVALLRQALN